MRSDTTFLKIILLLSLLGLLVAGKLLSVHVRMTSGQAGLTESCSLISASTGCASVAVSDYSDVAGIPLAALAMGFYVALILLTFWAMRNYQSAYEPLYVGFFLSTLSILVTVTMFYISRFVLKEFCQFCAMLWLINLAIWPSFVKQLGLGWGNALAGNLELVRHSKLNLRKERVMGCFGVAAVCLMAFSVIGLASKGLQGESPSYGDKSSLVKDYQSAAAVFLPAEAYGGAMAKGNLTGTPVLDIIEFADFQCPGCKMAGQFFRPFLLKHKDKVRLTFQNFPLDGSCNPSVPNGMHAFACAAAKHSICASKQGKFWEFHDQIYDRQDQLSNATIAEVVDKLGLDAAAMEACVNDPATNAQLQKSIQWADLIGLNSTPTLVVNGRKIEGAKTPADLESLLEAVEAERRGK